MTTGDAAGPSSGSRTPLGSYSDIFPTLTAPWVHYQPRTIKLIYSAFFFFLNDTAHSLLRLCELTFSFPPPVEDEAMGLLKRRADTRAAFLHVGGSSAGLSWVVGYSWFIRAVSIWHALLLRIWVYLQSCILLRPGQRSHCQ